MLTAERSLPSGERYRIVINTHCGVGYFSQPVNDVFWIADEANLELDWIPSKWADKLFEPGDDLLTVEVLLSADGNEMTATTAGRSVVYRQMTADDPVFECA